jgi:hypothetical protein
MTEIKMLEPKWSSPMAKEHYEFIQSQIVEAFRIPEYFLSAPYWVLLEAVANLQQQALDLYIRNTLPQMLTKI